MAQNIYDKAEFFAGYGQLRRSVEGLEGATEWPAMRAMLPDLRGKKIVDLGCGYGWFCRWAMENGAAQVLGLDLSEKMLERAAQINAVTGATYERADLDTLELPEASYDLAYSSLTLHYLADVGRFFGMVHRTLLPGGHFVFSTEHPVFMAPTHPGWSFDAQGRRTWPIDRYLVEGPRTTDWFTKGVLKYHRTIGTTLNLLIAAGFIIDHVEEFCPTPEQVAERPELVEELDRPMFLLVSARR